MAFWIAIAVLTAAATIALLAPIFRNRVEATSRDAEIAIYRDQLEELSRDVARGVLPESEAKSARNEIARRLLKASDDEGGAPMAGTASAPPKSFAYRNAAIVTLIVVPIISVGLYLMVGEPNEPDMPIEARLDNPADLAVLMQRVDALIQNPDITEQELAALGTRVDQAVAANPEEPLAWQAATVVYLYQGRYDDVVNAYGRMVASGGAEADPDGTVAVFLGEQMIARSQGMVPQAITMFGTAMQAHPENIQARFYTALVLTGLGDTETAIPAWRWIIDNAPPEAADYVAEARRQLQALGVEVEGAEAAPAGTPPPGAAEIAALPPEEQAARINQMVDNLAAELAANGGDADRWAQLVRSYIVLDRLDDAHVAVTNARSALAADPAQVTAFEENLIRADVTAVGTDPTQADVWARLILSYSVLGRLEDARQAVANARTALAGNPEALAVVDAAAQQLE